MSDLLVISGPPGSGKSTVAGVLAERWQPSVLVDGDAFFAFLRQGVDPWLPEADAQNHVVTAAAAAAAGRFVEGGMTTLYDGVVGPWFLPQLLAGSGLDRLDYAVLLPPLEVCLAGVRDRVGHGFTDADATEHMYRQFAAAGIEDRHVFAQLAPPGEVADAVVQARAAGGLRWAPGLV